VWSVLKVLFIEVFDDEWFWLKATLMSWCC